MTTEELMYRNSVAFKIGTSFKGNMGIIKNGVPDPSRIFPCHKLESDDVLDGYIEDAIKKRIKELEKEYEAL